MNSKSTGYRILHFPLTKILIGLIVILGIFSLAQIGLNALLKLGSFSTDYNNLIISAITATIAVVTYGVLYSYYEKRKITELSPTNIGANLLFGTLIGAGLQSLTIFVIYLFGGFQVVEINSFLFLVPALTLSVSSAILEEILFRGVLFRIIEEKLGSYIALIISALIFGGLHLLNPNSSIAAALGLAIQAGLLLGVAYMYTRNLWMPIALHFSWNFTQGGIFGASVSGNDMSKSLITSEITGAEWFSGGEFGPEGSVQATIFGVIATIILLYLCHRHNKIVAPYWSKMKDA